MKAGIRRSNSRRRVAGIAGHGQGGDPEAQFELAKLLHVGMGVSQDSSLAAAWCRQAAEQGHAPSQYNLGIQYFEGDGLPKDYKQAATWFL